MARWGFLVPGKDVTREEKQGQDRKNDSAKLSLFF
jgi:hypothetical protein